MLKAIGGLLAVIVGALALGFVLQEVGVIQYRFFGTQYEAARRDIMVQSRAYSEGETRNLYRMLAQYQHETSPDAKQTLRLAAQHECEAFDRSRLPGDLASFCNPLN